MEQQQLTIEGLDRRIAEMERVLEQAAAMMGAATAAVEDGCRQGAEQRDQARALHVAVDGAVDRVAAVETLADRVARIEVDMGRLVSALDLYKAKIDLHDEALHKAAAVIAATAARHAELTSAVRGCQLALGITSDKPSDKLN